MKKGIWFVVATCFYFILVSTAFAEQGWWIQIVGTTQATKVGIQTGPSKHDNECWGGWKKGESYNIRIRDKDQGYNHLFIQINNEEKVQVDAVVMYDDRSLKEYHFNGDMENHEIDRRPPNPISPPSSGFSRPDK